MFWFEQFTNSNNKNVNIYYTSFVWSYFAPSEHEYSSISVNLINYNMFKLTLCYNSHKNVFINGWINI